MWRGSEHIHTYIHSVIRVLNNINDLIYVSVPPAAAGEGTAVAAGAEIEKTSYQYVFRWSNAFSLYSHVS